LVCRTTLEDEELLELVALLFRVELGVSTDLCGRLLADLLMTVEGSVGPAVRALNGDSAITIRIE
jgi:hypothetical protein